MFGTGVSPGISIGTAYVIRNTSLKISGIIIDKAEMRDKEVDKFDNAVNVSVAEIEAMKENKKQILRQTELDILDTQIEFLRDSQIRTDVLEKINLEFKTAADAVIEAIEATITIFENIEDEYLSSRAADIKDIGKRILKNLDAGIGTVPSEFGENTIIIAEDITPSLAISFDIDRISGFATLAGGKTSHAAIIARSRGIPAVVACGDELMKVDNNEIVLIDGSTGEVILRPDQTTIGEFRKREEKYAAVISLLETLKDLPARSPDGKVIKLYANISGTSDLDKAFANGAEGIGLFRTEMLFMHRNSLPAEEEQFILYREVAENLKSKPVIIRTIDIGGDKNLPYLNIPGESNPFMGYRAIRLSLDRKDIFMTQIRAILRAGVYGDLKLMFPMVSNISEIRQAKEYVQEAKDDLTRSGLEFSKDIQTGIMIEIPAAALLADQFAREVDFFSIGTNDLCQYTLAVDRMNERVAYLYDHFNPAVLRLIHYVIEQACKNNIHVGLCGEMASDPLATILLMGMGLEEFSMSPLSIPAIKSIIRQTGMKKAEEIFNQVKEMDDSHAIREYLKKVSL